METEARVAIAEDLVLDFSGLFTEEAPESPVEPRLGPVEPFLGAGKYKIPYGATKFRRGAFRGATGERALS